MLKETLDKLHSMISNGRFEEDARRALALFREKTGATYEDDPSHENRMMLFTEWFILDYPSLSGSLPPLEIYSSAGVGSEEKRIIDALRKNVHDVFMVKWATEGRMKLLAVYMDSSFIVEDEEKARVLRKGDIFEARIIHLDGKWRLLNGFCAHPSKASKFIRAELSAIRAANGEGLEDFMARLSAMSLMSERSRNIGVEEIYKRTQAA